MHLPGLSHLCRSIGRLTTPRRNLSVNLCPFFGPRSLGVLRTFFLPPCKQGLQRPKVLGALVVPFREPTFVAHGDPCVVPRLHKRGAMAMDIACERSPALLLSTATHWLDFLPASCVGMLQRLCSTMRLVRVQRRLSLSGALDKDRNSSARPTS